MYLMTGSMHMFSLHLPTVCGGIGVSTILGVGDIVLIGIIALGMVRAIGVVGTLLITTIIIIIGIRDIIPKTRFMQV